MTCHPGQVSELPGSDVACSTINIRECLMLRGQDITDIIGTVHTDGVTLTGDGTTTTPVKLLAVQHDVTMTGAGTVASPLSVVGAVSVINTDGVTCQGDGTALDPVRLKQVETDSTMTGAGTLASRLTAQKIVGPSGRVDATDLGGTLLSLTSVSGADIAIQAQDANVGIAAGGAGPGVISMDAHAGTISIGTALDAPKLFIADLQDGAAIAVGPVGQARLRYNLGANRLEVSLNGAAYVAIVTL